MPSAQANLVRAASFLIGAVLAVLVSVQLGILEPRHPYWFSGSTTRSVIGVNGGEAVANAETTAPPSPRTSPVAVPIAPSDSDGRSPTRIVRATARRREPKPSRAIQPAVSKQKQNAAPPRSSVRAHKASPRRAPKTEPMPSQESSLPQTDETKAQRPLPKAYVRAQAAMDRLRQNTSATRADVNQTARILAVAAEELGQEAVALCVDRFFLSESEKTALLPCWQKLQKAMK